MMDQDDKPPPASAKKAAPAISRQKQAQNERLAESLRANLRRRKAQVRQRKVAATSEESGS
jgi:hypothetical protein